MHVNLLVHAIASEESGKTDIQVIAHVHDHRDIIGSALLYHSDRQETIPGDETNLNLWATALLRGVVAGMEERFLWTDQRPEATLIKNAIESKQV